MRTTDTSGQAFWPLFVYLEQESYICSCLICVMALDIKLQNWLIYTYICLMYEYAAISPSCIHNAGWTPTGRGLIMRCLVGRDPVTLCPPLPYAPLLFSFSWAPVTPCVTPSSQKENAPAKFRFSVRGEKRRYVRWLCSDGKSGCGESIQELPAKGLIPTYLVRRLD
jgi:hypothetical protein